MGRNTMKHKLQAKEVVCGVWLTWMDPNLVEFYGYLGFDFVLIDAEHQPVDKTNCLALVRAAHLVGMTAIVRPPDRDPSTILGFLELGAWGIYASHVQTAEEAREVVRAVKYAPLGHRSMSYPRPMRFGITDSPERMYREANEDTIVIVLVDEVEGIKNLDDILKVEGVDVVGIGDGDLSHAMGFVGRTDHPELRRVVDDAEARVAASGKVLDSVVWSTERALESLARGVTMVGVSDRMVIQDFGTRFLKSVRESPAAARGK